MLTDVEGSSHDLVWGIIWAFAWTEEILVRTNWPKLEPLFTYLLSYLLTYVLTYSLPASMEHIPSWEANRSSASHEIPRILWNLKVN
jgi:hypothetical protein